MGKYGNRNDSSIWQKAAQNLTYSLWLLDWNPEKYFDQFEAWAQILQDLLI